MTTKKTKNKLSEKAILINLTIHNYGGAKKDKKVTTTTCLVMQAKADAGSWWTRTIPKSEIDPITAASMKCRNILTKYTLPFLENGFRILPSARFTEFSKEMREGIENYHAVVSVFIKRYPEIVGNRQRLGKLAENITFPSVAEMKSKFSIRVETMNVPTTDDFRINLGDAEANEIKANVEDSINTALKNSMTEIWNQLAELIAHVEKTLKDPKKKFKDSLIDNLTNFCKLIPKINLSDDENLEELRKDIIEKLTKLNCDDLRTDKVQRKTASKKATDLLKKMQDYTA